MNVALAISMLDRFTWNPSAGAFSVSGIKQKKVSTHRQPSGFFVLGDKNKLRGPEDDHLHEIARNAARDR